MMVVKPGTRPDFLENIFTPNIIFCLPEGSLIPRVKKQKIKNFQKVKKNVKERFIITNNKKRKKAFFTSMV